MSDETKVNPEEPERALVSRRKFLGGVAGAGIGGLALAGILAACGQDDDGGEAAAPSSGEEPAATTAAGQTAADTSQPILIGSAYPTVNSRGRRRADGARLRPREAGDQRRGRGRRAHDRARDRRHEQLRRREHHERVQRPDQPRSPTRSSSDTTTWRARTTSSADYGAPFLNASTADWQVTEMRSDPEKYKNVFQADPTEVPYGTGFPPFLESLIAQGLFNPPSKSIYIIEGDIVYGQTIAAAAEEAAPAAGWEIVGKDPVDTAGGTAPVTDWAPFIANVRDSGASVVFNTHWNPADHAAFMKAWAADPPDAFVYLQYGASVPEFLELAGDAANGAVWATVLGTMNDPIGLASRSATRRCGTRPPASRTRARATTRSTCSPMPGASRATPRNFDANITELKRNIHRGVSGGYWFGHEDGELLPLLPGRDRRIRRSGTRTCSSRSCRTTPGPSRTRSSIRRRTSRRSTCSRRG